MNKYFCVYKETINTVRLLIRGDTQMLKSIPEFKSEASTYLLRKKQPQVGDRVKTSNQSKGTVVRIGYDEKGVFIVVRLESSPHEFVYDPDELEAI